jgi:hypothetical protein
MIPSEAQIILWQERLAALSDLELVAAYNREVNCKGWGTSRGYYLNYLRDAMEQRNFDASLVINRNSQGEINTFSLAFPVTLDTNNLKLIPKFN